MSDAPRPWYRLHLSTWLLLAPAVAVWFLLAVPGEVIDPNWGDEYEYGWPWTYCVQYRSFSPWSKPDLPPWRIRESYRFWTGERTWLPGNLTLDALVALASLAAIAAVLERLRRRSARWWQFSLREALVGVALVAVLLYQWIDAPNQFEREADAMGTDTSSLDATAHESITGPDWARKLFGPSRLIKLRGTRAFRHVVHFEPNGPIWHPKVLASVPRLRWLQVPEDLDYRFLRPLGELRSLQDRGPGGPCDLSALASLPHLRNLDLMRELPISDAELAALPPLAHLEGLVLKAAGLGDRGLAAIARQRNLRHVEIVGSTLSAAQLRQLSSLTQLERLTVSAASLDDAAIKMLLARPKLTSLVLDCPTLTESQLVRLSEHPSLAELILHDSDVTRAGLRTARKSPKLKIYVQNVQLSLAERRELRAAGAELEIYQSSTPGDDRSTVHMPARSRWVIGRPARSPAEVKAALARLRNVPDFTALDLQSDEFTDEALSELNGLGSLERLSIESENVTNLGLRSLRQMPALEFLTVRSGKVTSAVLPDLEELPRLRVVKLGVERFSRNSDGQFRPENPSKH